MFQTKATITGVIGAIALVVALFSPTKEITNADSLVGFASGQNVQTQTVQTNKGAISLLFLAAIGSAIWTVTGNDEAEAAAPVVQYQQTTQPVPEAEPAEPVIPVQAPIAGDTLADFWEQDVEFAVLAQQFDIATRSRLLKAALVVHEGGWILRLLHWPVLLVIGRPGSAKSSFAASLGITREVLNSAIQKTVVTDPNAHLKLKDGVWQAHWQLEGSRDNWKEIGDAISGMYTRFADSQGANHVSSIYDEVTTYKGNVDDKKLGGFLSQVTSKARACAEYITIVAHNDTLKALGGEAGEAKLKDDMAQLNLGSKATTTGLMVPTGTGAIEGLDVDEKNHPLSEPVTLPRWFDPEILRELFPELYSGFATGNEPVTESVTESVTGGYTLAPVTEVEPPCNHPGTDEGNAVTACAARVSAAVHLSSRIYNDLGFLVEVSTILAAADALSEGRSDSNIIKDILGCKGRNFNDGKAALELIKQTFTTTED
ncbi:MAG: hypothetical protein DCF25_16050 [Leptolyngbya foveolarum]|uniref:Uncharacterized protein n=1 Tax=Leptolyngbya foveolarum TaxID=47253 RepID=A0A2W4U2P2_9CYAN|nr:MAG: hypothetical protein DCF25_16050 [Leptolyngbya foveolarum]